METFYCLASFDGRTITIHPVSDPDEIVDFTRDAEFILTATDRIKELDVTLFFSKIWPKRSMMYEAMDNALETASFNVKGAATNAQVDTWLRAKWTEIAFASYKYYRELGRGCFFFGEGITKGNAFDQVYAEYTSSDRLADFFARLNLASPSVPAALQAVASYDPETSLVAYFPQTIKSVVAVYGVLQGLPAPRSVWELHKDDPQFRD